MERWRTLKLLKKSQKLHNANPRNLVYFKYSVTFHIEGGLSHEKLTAIITGALTVLAISATAFAANLISADEARAIAQKQVPTGSTYLHTEVELQNCTHIMKWSFLILLLRQNMKLIYIK